MNSGQLKMACLGRPFHLGMLYDRRSETIIPGKTLWNSTFLKSHKQTIPKPYCNCEIISQDTLQKKSFNLDISAELKLSFMGGLVQVSGAAKYIDDRKSSEQQARVTLKYTSTSRFEEMSMEQMASIQYPEVLDDADATHVVSGALYGADAFFVFDYQMNENENMREVQGNMEALIKFIPEISVGGNASINLKDNEEKKAKKFTCKFFGDIILPANPSTFEDAIMVYRDLPKYICNENVDKNVPKVVYLYPLTKLNRRPQKIIHSISSNLVIKIEDILESIHNMEMKCYDLQKQDTCCKFIDIDDQLSNFAKLLERFKMDLVKKIADILPKIRSTGAQEKELADMISDILSSPFSPERMKKYIRNKDKEIKLLSQHLKFIKQGEKCVKDCFAQNNDLVTLTLDTNCIIFAFNVTSKMCGYLRNMENYFQGEKTTEDEKEWYDERKSIQFLTTLSKRFGEFVKMNTDNENLTFAVTDNNEESSGPGIILYYESFPEDFDPPSNPGKPKNTTITHRSISLTWSKPEFGLKEIESYDVLYKAEKSENWSTQRTKSTKMSIEGLYPSQMYHIKVQAVCRVGVSPYSESITVTTKPSPITRPAEYYKQFSTLIQHGKPSTYMLPLTKVLGSLDAGIFKYNIGNSSTSSYIPEKVLMVVGATGAGKSTLINGVANHVLGVKWEDNFRFKVITDVGESGKSEAHSQTKHITAYRFFGTNLPYVLTIVDTPGFGDTEGIESDQRIAKQIKQFFSIPGSINHINGIGFVIQASLARLTPTQKYIFDAVLTKFGKDIGDNIFLMTTFADANEPPVLKSVSEGGINYKENFKFNNSAIFASNTDKSKFNSMFWEMGAQSFADFFKHFTVAESKSLSLTRQVLQEREQLETLLPGLQQQIKSGLSKLDEIEQEQRVLKQHEADIKANKNFEYEIEIHKHEKIPLHGVNTTNCLKCCFTCHDSCIYSDNEDKAGCRAMEDGYCTVCPDKCHWREHQNTPFRYKYFDEMIKVKRTHENLKERYMDAQSKKSKMENMISNSEEILHRAQNKVFRLIEKARKSVERLQEIALRPNALSETEYLSLLIENEKEEKKPGWQRRSAMYQKLIDNAEIIKKLPEIPINDPKSKSFWKIWTWWQ